MLRYLITLLMLTEIILSGTNIFVLCEGNFGQANASLWIFDYTFGDIDGPIYQNLTGNPLGDTGQSMTVYGDKLYVINNGSHTVEVLNLANGIEYEATIDVMGASPREMEVVNGRGYLTCWYLNGIMVLDLATNTIIDTISVPGLPEDIVHHNGKLYTSLTMNPDWSSADQILEIDLSGSEYDVSNTFQVIPGPGQLLIHNDFLYVASIYYDESWNTYSGTCRIDLNTGEVTTLDYGMTSSYGTDLTEFQGMVYRTYGTGIAPVTDSLTVDETAIIGNLSGIYSMASNGDQIYFGLSDYVAPDTVTVLDASGQEVVSYQVGPIPGAFAFYTPTQVSVNESSIQPVTFSLSQNYPNPFNKTTVIEFTVSEQADVKFTIYDIMGQEVSVLLNNRMNSGSHSFVWDASNFSSGLYIGVLSVNGHTATRKMILLK